MLNINRRAWGLRLKTQKDMTRLSNATVSVPAGTPKRSTDVKTKVSETETVDGIDDSLTVADPLTRVSTS